MIRLQVSYQDLLDAVKQYLSPQDIKLIHEAYQFAEKAHREQFRKSGEPYILHPIAVALYLTTFRLGPEALCAALLHDVVEDTEVSVDNIKNVFGENIANLVDSLTKVDVTTLAPGSEHNITLLQKILTMTSNDIRTLLIKFADRLHNMETLDALHIERQMIMAHETLEIYYPLAQLLGIGIIVEDLGSASFRHIHPTEFQKISEILTLRTIEDKAYLASTVQTIEEQLAESEIRAIVEGRIRTPFEIYNTLKKQKREFADINDIFLFRITTESSADCYRILGIIHTIWKPDFSKFRDFIAVPRMNHYQALQTSVFSSNGVRARICIQTHDMFDQSNVGVCSRFLYAKNPDSPEICRLDSEWTNDLSHLKDHPSEKDFVDALRLDWLQDRIVVFTPQGDSKYLPKGASVLDFAYGIHTDIGQHISEASINGVKRPIHHELTNGDTVSVTTDEHVSPQAMWLSYTKTHNARNAIRHYLKSASKEEKVHLGRDLFIAVLKRYTNMSLASFEMRSRYQEYMKKLSLRDPSEIYIRICEGTLSPEMIIEKVLEKSQSPFAFLFGSDQNIQNKDFKLVTMEIIGIDRKGMLADITSCISRKNINIASFQVGALHGSNRFYYLCTIEVASEAILQDLFATLEIIPEVQVVRRIETQKRTFIKFTFTFSLIILAHLILLFLLRSLSTWFYVLFLPLSLYFFYFCVRINRSFMTFLSQPMKIFYFGSLAILFYTLMRGEVLLFSMPFDVWHWLYLIVLSMPMVLCHFINYILSKVTFMGRVKFFCSHLGLGRKLAIDNVLHRDIHARQYDHLAHSYENYFFLSQKPLFVIHKGAKTYLQGLHQQLHVLFEHNHLSDQKILGVFACGPKPVSSHLSSHIIDMLRQKKLKKIVLTDFSQLALISAIEELIEYGVPYESIAAYQMDLTRGISSYFSEKLKELMHKQPEIFARDLAILTDQLSNIEKYITIPEYHFPRHDICDYLVSSLFTSSTLGPIEYEIRQQVICLASHEHLRNDFNQFIRNYNFKIFSLIIKSFPSFCQPDYFRSLLLYDLEEFPVCDGASNSCNPVVTLLNTIPNITDQHIYNMKWQDESQQYHKLESVIIDVRSHTNG